ncbi:MAG: hypothetical protein IKI84_13485 [Clostridia bacterium]|nr:hypothetical protein [Clostridia bacterium]
MKKLLAITLCMALLLGCTALAGGKQTLGTLNGMFAIECTVPDGYQTENIASDGNGMLVVSIRSADAAKPYMVLSVAFDEMMADVERLNDLDENAIAAIESSFTSEDNVEITYTETAFGTKLMVVKEVADSVEYVDFFTVYKGYSIEFVLLTDSAAGLTDHEIEMAVKFLSDMEFVPAE